MKAKWKIFLALNLLLSLPVFCVLIITAIQYINYYRYVQNHFVFIVFCLGFLIIVFNGFLNIYVLQRYYPDKLLPVPVRNFNMIMFIISIVVAIAAFFLLFTGFQSEFSRKYPRRDSIGILTLIIMSAAWIIDIFILVMQGQLSSLISRNNRSRMQSLIDSIGQPDNEPV